MQATTNHKGQYRYNIGRDVRCREKHNGGGRSKIARLTCWHGLYICTLVGSIAPKLLPAVCGQFTRSNEDCCYTHHCIW